MPWTIQRDDRCPAERPWGVVKEGGELEGCHPSKTAAREQQKALYASEKGETRAAGGRRTLVLLAPDGPEDEFVEALTSRKEEDDDA